MNKNEKVIKTTGIDAVDLLLVIVSAWKKILIFILIFSLIFCGYGLYKEKTSENNSRPAEAYAASLTNEEKDAVTDAAKLINSYKEKYKEQKNYNENSILQNLDARSINTMQLALYVDNNYQVVYPIANEENNVVALVQAYSNYLSSNDLFERMSEEIDKNVLPTYYNEVVEVDFDNQKDGVILVKIYGYDNNMLNAMSDVIESSLEEFSKDLAKQLGDHTIIVASKSYSITVDNDIYTQQQDNLANLTYLKSSIEKVEKEFDGNSLLYLQKLVHEEEESSVSIVKYVVIGFVVGLVLCLFCELFGYIFNFKLKNALEIEEVFGLELIGFVSKKLDIKKQLARKIYCYRNGIKVTETYDSLYSLLEAKIDVIAKKAEGKVGFVLAADIDYECEELIKEITSKNNILMVKDILTDSKEFSKLVECREVVFVNQIQVSQYKDITNECKLCLNNDIEIMGSIVID